MLLAFSDRLTTVAVAQLLDHGAKVDATSAKGRTALQRAVKGNSMMFPMDIKMVDLLLQAGACPFSADNKGWLPHDPVHVFGNKSSSQQTCHNCLVVRWQGHALSPHTTQVGCLETPVAI